MEKDKSIDGGLYDQTGSATHYKSALLEYIDQQEQCYGTVFAYMLCKMQEDKYRSRAGKKAGVTVEKDIIKAQWYDDCSKHLRAKIDLFNRAASAEELRKYEEKYGYGRSTYVKMPWQLQSLLQREMDIIIEPEIRTLEQIVNEEKK